MGLLDDCEKYYDTHSLYEVLGIQPKSGIKQIKKAYYRAAMKVHPDKVSEEKKEYATKLFQILGKVYDVLQDNNKRRIYDSTGEVDDETISDSWTEYFAKLFKVDSESIKKFTEEYQGSNDEKEDLKSLYLKFKGDITQIMDNHLCSTYEDEERISEMIKCMIDAGDVPEFKAYTNESVKSKVARRKRGVKEAKEAEQHARDLGISLDDKDSLVNAIRARKQQDVAFLDGLAAKYAKDNKAKSKSKGKK